MKHLIRNIWKEKDPASVRWEKHLEFCKITEEIQTIAIKLDKLSKQSRISKDPSMGEKKLEADLEMQKKNLVALGITGQGLTKFETGVRNKMQIGSPPQPAIIALFKSYQKASDDAERSNYLIPSTLPLPIPAVKPADFSMLSPFDFLIKNQDYINGDILINFYSMFKTKEIDQDTFFKILNNAYKANLKELKAENFLQDLARNSLEAYVELQRNHDRSPKASMGVSPAIYAAEKGLRGSTEVRGENGKLIILSMSEKCLKIGGKDDVFEYLIENGAKIEGMPAAEYAIKNNIKLGGFLGSDGEAIGKIDPVIFLQRRYATKDEVGYVKDKYKVNSLPPFEYALVNNINIAGRNPAEWLMNERNEVNGKSALVYLIENNVMWGDELAIKSLIKNNVIINGQHAAVYLQAMYNKSGDKRFLIDAMHPMDYALIQASNDRGNLKIIVDSYDKHPIPFDGSNFIESADKTLLINGMPPIIWALSKGKEFFDMIELKSEIITNKLGELNANDQAKYHNYVEKAQIVYRPKDPKQKDEGLNDKNIGGEPAINYIIKRYDNIKRVKENYKVPEQQQSRNVVTEGGLQTVQQEKMDDKIDRLEDMLKNKVIDFYQGLLVTAKAKLTEIKAKEAQHYKKIKEEQTETLSMLDARLSELPGLIAEIDKAGEENVKKWNEILDQIDKLDKQMKPIEMEINSTQDTTRKKNLEKQYDKLTDKSASLNKQKNDHAQRHHKLDSKLNGLLAEKERLESEKSALQEKLTYPEEDNAYKLLAYQAQQETEKLEKLVTAIKKMDMNELDEEVFDKKIYGISTVTEIQQLRESIYQLYNQADEIETNKAKEMDGFVFENADIELERCLIDGMTPLRYALNSVIEGGEIMMINGVDPRIYAFTTGNMSIREFISFMDCVPEKVIDIADGNKGFQVETPEEAQRFTRNLLEILPEGEEERKQYLKAISDKIKDYHGSGSYHGLSNELNNPTPQEKQTNKDVIDPHTQKTPSKGDSEEELPKSKSFVKKLLERGNTSDKSHVEQVPGKGRSEEELPKSKSFVKQLRGKGNSERGNTDDKSHVGRLGGNRGGNKGQTNDIIRP
jgi:hypothetical protein